MGFSVCRLGLEGVLGFFVFVALVSASGALSPGPLFVATVNHALRGGGRVGWVIAAGHMAFELPLVLGISLGVLALVNEPLIRFYIGVLGAAALIGFGALQSADSLRKLRSEEAEIDGGGLRLSVGRGRILFQAFLIGLLFTGLNPYFLIWWFTIGLTLVVEGFALASLAGVFLMYVFHVWLDYLWLGFVAHATAAGSRFLRGRAVDLISFVLAMALIGLGVWLLASVLLT